MEDMKGISISCLYVDDLPALPSFWHGCNIEARMYLAIQRRSSFTALLCLSSCSCFHIRHVWRICVHRITFNEDVFPERRRSRAKFTIRICRSTKTSTARSE